jgi:ABC-type transport system involved in multi-copper enzyme maturation permease subunit
MMLGPIFAREWRTLPRRPHHYLVRTANLGLLWVLGVTAWQATVGWRRPAGLGETARFGLLLFQLSGYFQLTLLLFFAALSAAGTIAQEKDRRTFVLLLATDLRNHEIVLGKLAGSLVQIGLLLLGTVGLLALGLLLGGVAWEQMAQAVVVLAGTCLAAGSLGCLVALWRDQTFQALALTVLFLVLYFCLVRALGLVPPVLSWVGWRIGAEPWQAVQLRLDPYQCLQSVLEPPAGNNELPAPAGFAMSMVLISMLLNAWSIRRLRVWNPSGEPIVQREQPTEQVPSPRLAATEESAFPPVAAKQGENSVRPVWANPILWREIRTQAYGRRPLLVKAAYLVVIALIVYYLLSPDVSDSGPLTATGLLPVSILSLLLVAAQSVTAITSERDKGALDLLLVTDLSPKEFIFGKLGGIAYNTKEFVVPALVLAGYFAWEGVLATPPRGHEELRAARNLGALACVAAVLMLLFGFVTVLGMHIGLRTEVSQPAITHTLGTVFFLSVGTLVTIWLISVSGRFEVQWTSFVLFLGAGVAGMWWVLNGDRPSPALFLASWLCPLAIFYAVVNILIGKPGSEQSSDPFMPALVLGGAFGFTITAMLVPLLSEFDVALGRTTGPNE